MQHGLPMLCSFVPVCCPGLALLMSCLPNSLTKPSMHVEMSKVISRAYLPHSLTPGQSCCCAAVKVWEAAMALSFQLRPFPTTAPTQQQHQGHQPWHTTLCLVQAAPFVAEAVAISGCHPPPEKLLLLSKCCSLLRSELIQGLQVSRSDISGALEEAASATDGQQVQGAQLEQVQGNQGTSSMAHQQRQQQQHSMVSLQQQSPQGGCQQWEAQVQCALRGPSYLGFLLGFSDRHCQHQPLLASLVDCLFDFYLHDDMQQLPSQLQNLATKQDTDCTFYNSCRRRSRSSSSSSSNSQDCCKGYEEESSSSSRSSSRKNDGMEGNRFSCIGDEPKDDLRSNSNRPLSTPQNICSSNYMEQQAAAIFATVGTPSPPPPPRASSSAPSCVSSKHCEQAQGLVATGEPFSAPSAATPTTAAAAAEAPPEAIAKQENASADPPVSVHAEVPCMQSSEGWVTASPGAPWLLLQLPGAEAGTGGAGSAQGSPAISADASLRVVLDLLLVPLVECGPDNIAALSVDTRLRLTVLLLVLLQKCSVNSRVELLQAGPYGTRVLSMLYVLLPHPQDSAYSRRVKEPWDSDYHDVVSKPGCIQRLDLLGAASVAIGGKALRQPVGEALMGLPSGRGLGSGEDGCSQVLLLLQHLLLEPTPGLVIGPEHVKQGGVMATGRGEV